MRDLAGVSLGNVYRLVTNGGNLYQNMHLNSKNTTNFDGKYTTIKPLPYSWKTKSK